MFAYLFVFAAVALPNTDRFIGIVELPALGAVENPERDTAAPVQIKPGAIVLHKEPDVAAATVATITDANQLAVEEFAYDATAPTVYGRIHGWYLVLTRAGQRGWLGPKDAGKFHSYRDLAGDWAGVAAAAALLSAPDMKASPAKLQDVAELDESDLDVRIIESKQSSDTLWFKVEVLQDVCDGEGKRVKGTGWVPAHDKKGEHTLVFRTRGC